MLNFLIDTSKGETPASVARKRALVAQLMGQSSAPKNVGEGLNALGDGIVAAVMNRRADKAEAAGRGEGSNAFASLFSGLGGVDTQAPEMAGNTAVSPGALPTQDYPSQRVSQAFGAASSDGSDVESYIRRAAAERGIDPEIAIKVARSEGGLKDPFRQSDIVKNGVREQSYGPFQLYMGGGLGNKALEAGIDPRKDWQGGINFALDQAASGGWGPWYGAKKIGVTGMTGIGQRPTGQVASLDPMAGMPDAQMTPEQIVRSFAQSRPQMSPPVDPAMNGMAPPNPSRFAPDAQPVVPGIPGQQTMPLGPEASGKPQGAGSPGEIRKGTDGQTYQYVETTGMAGATGSHGWIPVNVSALQGGQQPTGLAAAQPPQPAQMPPMGQPAPQPPMQVAQAGQGQFPPAPPPPQNNRVQQLMQVMTNPWLSDQERQVAGMMLQQEMQKMDPMRQLEMEKTRLEMEAMRNPKPNLINGGDGRLYDPASGKWITAPDAAQKAPQVVELFDEASGQPYKATWNAETKQYERVGGVKARTGMQLTTNPDGTVSLTEGPISNRPKLTADEAKNAGFLERGVAANKVLEELEGQGTSLWNKTIGNVPVFGNYARSEDAQKYDQAKRDLVNAILRRESGAVISDEEFANAEQQYFPQPGDGPEVVEQKRKNREAAIKGFDIGAGQGAGMVTNPPGQVKRLKFNPQTGELE